MGKINQPQTNRPALKQTRGFWVQTKTISNMNNSKSYFDRIESVRKSGHGHFAVTFNYYGKAHTATISDMTLIDAFKDQDATESDARDLFFAAKSKIY